MLLQCKPFFLQLQMLLKHCLCEDALHLQQIKFKISGGAGSKSVIIGTNRLFSIFQPQPTGSILLILKLRHWST